MMFRLDLIMRGKEARLEGERPEITGTLLILTRFLLDTTHGIIKDLLTWFYRCLANGREIIIVVPLPKMLSTFNSP